jgi:hypothetical protein
MEVRIIKEHLDKQILKWQEILNSHYKTDEGTDLGDYAQGTLTAYIELKAFIEHEELNGKSE